MTAWRPSIFSGTRNESSWKIFLSSMCRTMRCQWFSLTSSMGTWRSAWGLTTSKSIPQQTCTQWIRCWFSSQLPSINYTNEPISIKFCFCNIPLNPYLSRFVFVISHLKTLSIIYIKYFYLWDGKMVTCIVRLFKWPRQFFLHFSNSLLSLESKFLSTPWVVLHTTTNSNFYFWTMPPYSEQNLMEVLTDEYHP